MAFASCRKRTSKSIRHYLDGHIPVQQRVPGAPHFAHPAFADPLLENVVPYFASRLHIATHSTAEALGSKQRRVSRRASRRQ